MQAYQTLFSIFSQLHPLSNPLKEAIIKASKIMEVGKKEILLKEGDKSNYIYFITKGAIRVYYLNKKGEQSNTWFLLENELAISVYSFFTAQPSFEYIETLEDCSLIALSKSELDKLYERFVEFNVIGRKLTELYYIRNEAHANALRMLPAKERYQQLLYTQPALLNRISLGHIASYLGISPETLSRIRKNI